MDVKFCRDCGENRPVTEFTRNRNSKDGLAFYCAVHARRRHISSRDERNGPPRSRHPRDRGVPPGYKWCPDCDTVKPWSNFGRNAASKSDRTTYCKACHNARGRAAKEKVGGERTYHLKRRYGITAAEADAMLATQGGVCAICRAAPAVHVDHDHATGAVRALLCFNCNGGLGQFHDDPAVLLAALAYLEKHAGGVVVTTTGCAAPARLGSDRRDRRGVRPGRRSTDRPVPGLAQKQRPGPDGPAEEAHG